MLRSIVVLLIIIFNIVFQSTIIQEINIGGISINLLLITAVSFGMIRGKIEGAIIGFFLGFMQDIFFGSVLGFYSILYMYTGFICGYFNRSFYRDSILIPISIVAICDLILNFIIYIFTYLFRGRLELGYYFPNIIMKELVYTTFVSIFIYKFYLTINNKLELIERNKEDKDIV